ncbi:ATP-binding protein, partial [Dehalococcoidia bacterium]|nr:ATP-binding protein [Dehalococcoidia bacterium]
PDISLEEIAQMLEGYSGADIRRIGEKACDIPFVESVRTGEERDVQRQDLLSVMQQVKPSVSAKALEKFQRFCFGR